MISGYPSHLACRPLRSVCPSFLSASCRVKPQHLLLSGEADEVLKIADFRFAVDVSRSRGTSVDLLSDKSPFPECEDRFPAWFSRFFRCYMLD